MANSDVQGERARAVCGGPPCDPCIRIPFVFADGEHRQ